MSIQNELDKIKNAVYGKEVRGAIHDGIKKTYDDASIEKDNANMEVKMARGKSLTLGSRLDRMQDRDEQLTTELNKVKNEKANVSYVDAKVQAANLAWRESYDTLAELQAAYPTGDSYNHTVLSNNMIYTWFNGIWTNTEVQANGAVIAPNSVDEAKATFFRKSSKNLLNPLTTKEKTKIDTETDGREQSFEDVYADHRASDFIEVFASEHYVTNTDVRSVVFFDSNRSFIGSFYEPEYRPEIIFAGVPFKTPINTKFMRVNLNSNSTVKNIQVERGKEVTDFEPYFIPPSHVAPKSIKENMIEDGVLNKFATKYELERIDKDSATNDDMIIPSDFKGWKLLDAGTKANEWKLDSARSTALGTVSNISKIDASKFSNNVSVPEKTLNPWLFSDDGAMAGLSHAFGKNMLKFEVTEKGHAFFHRSLKETEDFSQSGEMAFAVWVDKFSTDADKNANIQQTAYHKYPEDLSKFHRVNDGYPAMVDGRGTWVIVTIPSIRQQVRPRIWGQEGSAPYGIETLKTTDGIGFRITNSSDEGKIARFYVSGIFKIENTLDRGKLIITFDDGFESQYTEAFKYMHDNYGYKGNVAMVGSWTEKGEMGQFPEVPAMSKSQMLEIQRNGWDIVSHTWEHKNLGFDGYSPEYIYEQIQRNYEWLKDNGIGSGKRFMMYPEGSWNKTTLEIIQPFHSLSRTTSPIYIQINPALRQHTQPSIDAANFSESEWRDLLKTLEQQKTVASRHFHHIGTGGWNPITVEKFRLFIDIISEYDIDVITWSEYYDNYVAQK